MTQNFEETVVNALPLTLEDSWVASLAGTYGWQDAWMEAQPAKRRRETPPSQDLPSLMSASRPVPPFTPAASPASAPFTPAAGPVFALSRVNTRPSARAAGATAKAAAVPGPEAHAPRVALAPPAAPVAAPADPAPLAAPDPAPAADASPGPASPLRLPPPAAAEDDGEQPICVICHDVMARNTEQEALHCGHTFHRVCMEEWRAVAGVARGA